MATSKLPAGVKRIGELTSSDVECYEAIAIENSSNGDRIDITGSWNELLKIMVYMAYSKDSSRFTGRLFENMVIDSSLDITNQKYSIATAEGIVNVEEIPGTPYYLMQKGETDISKKLIVLTQMASLDKKTILVKLTNR